MAARLCYSKGGIKEVMAQTRDDEKNRKLIQACFEAGHESILEHASLTFGVEGISRACSHQLVRHRLTSISQQSQRYVDMNEAGDQCIYPRGIHPEADGLAYMGFMETAWHHYAAMQAIMAEYGLTGEEANQDARYVLPNACPTNLIWTMNFRELIHICSVRLCKRAQWEIRGVVGRMVDLLFAPGASDDLQFLGGFLTPKCASLGYCPEGEKSCGLFPKKAEVLGAWQTYQGVSQNTGLK